MSIDHIALGLSRITSQYQDQPDFTAFMTALLEQSENLQTAGDAILLSVDIDIAVGSQLDLIGRIVGIGRSLPHAVNMPFFGFTVTENGLPYGDDIFGGGGSFYDPSLPLTETLEMADPQYRQFIRAKVIRNRSTGTTEDFISVLRAVFPADTILVSDAVGKLQVNIGLNRPTTVAENATLEFADIMPKPAGVALAVLPYVAFILNFGFDPTGAPYGDDVTGGGGPFAEDTY